MLAPRVRSLGIGAMEGSFPTDRGLHSSPRLSSWRPQLPPALGASMMARLFIQRVDIGVLVVRATVQGYIPGKQVTVIRWYSNSLSK